MQRLQGLRDLEHYGSLNSDSGIERIRKRLAGDYGQVAKAPVSWSGWKAVFCGLV